MLIALPVSGAEYVYTAQRGEWLFIPVSLPQDKIGGGDFYNLRIEIDPDNDSTEYTQVIGGVRFRSESIGTYSVMLGVDHVTKSSCAGVEVDQLSDDKIEVHVVE